MSGENKDDLQVGSDDLVHTCDFKVKVEVGESEDEDWVPLIDPLSPSSDFVPTTRRYETRKRHAKTVLFQRSDSHPDKGSDWEPEEEGETRQKNIKRVKIIKVDDGLSSASSQTGVDEQRKVGRRQSKGRQKKQKSVNSDPELKEHPKTDKGNDGGVTETLESTMSEAPPEKNIQRKRQGSKMTPEGRRQKLQSAKKFEVTGEVELDVRISVRQSSSQQTYLERLEAKNAARREASRKLREKMTPEERAERNRKVCMANAMKKATMTEEQRQEKRQKEYLWNVIRRTKQSAEEFEAERKKQRARSLAYRRKMLEERREEFLTKANQYMKKYWKSLTLEERRRRIAKSEENARRTPEQRERMRQKTRLNWGKFELRQKLAAEGVPPEQVAEKVREFVANFVYKPSQIRRRRKCFRAPKLQLDPVLLARTDPAAFPSQVKRKRRTCSGRGAPVKLQLQPELLARIDPAEQLRVERRFNNTRTYLRKRLEKAGVPPEEMEEKFKELKASYEKFGRLDGEDYRPPPKLKPNETPEQRDARLMKARVAVAKCSLRKRLTAEGEPPEVIEEKLRELVSRYEAKAKEPITFRPHKPRAKQKRWIRNKSEVATCQDSPQAAASVSPTNEETQTSLSPSPSSPNSYCEPDHSESNTASPQRYESPEMSTDRPQMHQELKMGTVQFPVGNNDPPTSSTPTSTFEQPEPVDLRRQETFIPPEPISPSTPPPEADLSDDGFEQEEHVYQEKFFPPRPKKTRRRSPSRGSVNRRRGPPDGPRRPYKAKGGPVVTCELCGNAYSPDYIEMHKKLVHNPNWVNGKCVACGMEFSVGKKFLVHYNSAHVYAALPNGKSPSKQRLGPKRRRRRELTEQEQAFETSLVVCKLCGMSVRRSEIVKHKKVEHHPNYEEGKCTLCNAEFQGGVAFYEHFQREHRDGKRKWERKQNFVCAQCGDGFASAQYLSTHEYSVHGEGSKEDNFTQCPFCIHKFRSQTSLNGHLRNVHPEEEASLGSRLLCHCRRCGKKCRTNKVLREHVSAHHPDSYFPCPHCERVMYTEQNLNDHFLLCKVKRSGGDDEDGPFADFLNSVPLKCEFCSKEMRLDSLRRHYRVVHGVVEEPCWRCGLCSQTFSRRHFWLNHLDGKHGMPLDDELKEAARKMNVADRSQVEIKNLKGIRRWRVYKNKGKRKSRSPKSIDSDCSEADGDKERTSDDEESDERSEDEGDAQKNKAIEVASLRRTTRSGRLPPPFIKPEIPEVEKERRLVISVVRMSDEEISKWTSRSAIIVCKVECE